MPNHVTQIVEMSGPQEAIDALKSAVSSTDDAGNELPFSLHKIIPRPDIFDKISSGGITIDGEQVNRWVSEEINGERVNRKLNEEEIKAAEEAGASSWYDWCVNNWGTKWDVYSISEESPDNTFSFDTAWSPPMPAYEVLSERHPDVSIKVKYIDEGWGFAGVTIFEKGMVVSETNIPCERDSVAFQDFYKEVYGELPDYWFEDEE